MCCVYHTFAYRLSLSSSIRPIDSRWAKRVKTESDNETIWSKWWRTYCRNNKEHKLFTLRSKLSVYHFDRFVLADFANIDAMMWFFSSGRFNDGFWDLRLVSNCARDRFYSVSIYASCIQYLKNNKLNANDSWILSSFRFKLALISTVIIDCQRHKSNQNVRAKWGFQLKECHKFIIYCLVD